VSASFPMKLGSSNCANESLQSQAEPSCANGWRFRIRLLMLDGGRVDVHAIWVFARISSICVVAPSFTIYTSWLVPSSFRLGFKRLLDFLTDTLAPVHHVSQMPAWHGPPLCRSPWPLPYIRWYAKAPNRTSKRATSFPGNNGLSPFLKCLRIGKRLLT
jgi:hypothetical protein